MSKPDLNEMTKDQLLRLAAKKRVAVTRTMLKGEIVAALKKERKKSAQKKTRKKEKEGPKKSFSGRKEGSVAGRAAQPEKRATPTARKAGVSAKKPVPPAKGKSESKIAAPAQPRSPGKVRPRAGKRADSRKAYAKKSPGPTRRGGKRPSPAAAAVRESAGMAERTLRPRFQLEDMAQEAKFIVGSPQIPEDPLTDDAHELPSNYGDNLLVMMARDPYWSYLYWELQPARIEEGLRILSLSLSKVRCILRVYPQSLGSEGAYDVNIDFRWGHYYLQLSPPGETFYVEIGLLEPNGQFFALAESNRITLPMDRASEVVDETWMTTEEEFWKIYALSGGGVPKAPGGSGDVPGIQETGVRQWTEMSSETVSRSGSGPTENPSAEKSFRFWMDAELILYGGADPGSSVQMGGERLPLRPDGTFSARFALPEGTVRLPVTFESPGKTEVHTAIQVVTRKVRREGGTQ